MLKFIGKIIKILLVLGVLIAIGAFYAGTQWNTTDDDDAVKSLDSETAPTAEAGSGKTSPKTELPASDRAKAVLFELRIRKKTAERRLKETESQIARLEARNADAERIRNARETAESLNREIKNCDDAIAVAQAKAKQFREEENRSRENEAGKLLEKI